MTNGVFITVKGRRICIEWFFIDFEIGEASIVVKHLHIAYSHRIDLDFFDAPIDIEMDTIAEYANLIIFVSFSFNTDVFWIR